MNKPLVSVVMSVYNEPERSLKESIESILKQTFSDFEFIIILDKPDNKLAHETVESYASKDGRINIISNEKNEGLARSLNKGFLLTRGDYIARMDGDDISFPHRLERQLLFMENNPSFSLIGSSIIYIDENKSILGMDLTRSDYNFLRRLILCGGTPCFHPTWFFKKGLLDKIKGYRDLPTSQDFDFLMRLFYLGIKVSNIEEPLLYQRLHFGRISSEKNLYQIKLTRYIMKAASGDFILDDNKFSQSVVNKILKTPKIFSFLHRHSSHLLNLSYKFNRGYKKPMGFLLYIVGILFSPYQLGHIMYRFIVKPLKLKILRIVPCLQNNSCISHR